jgi:Predicted membrane protein
MAYFLRNKGIIGGIFMIVFYQLAMLGIFLSGYSAIPKNMPNLSVAIVNEDKPFGEEFVRQLSGQLPFQIITDMPLEEAQAELQDRHLHMIVHLPSDFSQKLSSQGGQATINYYVNGSNPSTVTSSMTSVSAQISEQIRTQLQPPNASAESIMPKVSSHVVTTNPMPAGLNNQMAPMFLSMAMYVGAMIYSMQSLAALNQIMGIEGKWAAFLSLQGLNIIIALIAPLIGVGIVFAVHSYDFPTFLKEWLVHALELFAAIEFTSIPVMLRGQAGMIVNIPLLLSQTIAGGSVMVREMMPGYFKAFSYISPLFYSINLDYNILFGGGRTLEFVLCLAMIAVLALLLNALFYSLKLLRMPAEIKEPTTQSLAIKIK